MEKIIDVEKSDQFDVLVDVAYALEPPFPHGKRGGRIREIGCSSKHSGVGH
jgi:hypothetical protein